MIGIRELARHLGVSIGTVSRALNDKADVNPVTRARVREAATRLGYAPNQSGRSLRRGRTDLVGVIVPVGRDNALINNVFLSVLEGLRRKLIERRLDLAIFLQGQDEDAFGSLQRVVERGLVDGLVISDTQKSDPRIDYLIRTKRPFVAFGRSGSGSNYPWVDPDFETAVERALDHLIELDHRHIALVLPESEKNFLHLIANTYRSTLQKRGLPFEPALLIRREGGERGGFLAADALLARQPQPTAVVVSEALQTVGLYRRFAEHGLRPGRDISVLGVMPEGLAQMLRPTLSAFVTDWTAIGARLGEALIGVLFHRPSPRAKPAPQPMQVIVPTHFVEGESVHRVQAVARIAIPAKLRG